MDSDAFHADISHVPAFRLHGSVLQVPGPGRIQSCQRLKTPLSCFVSRALQTPLLESDASTVGPKMKIKKNVLVQSVS